MAGETIDLFGRPIIDLTPNPLQPFLDAKNLAQLLPIDCLDPVRTGPTISTKVMVTALAATTLVAASVTAKSKPLAFAQQAPAAETDEVFVTGDSIMVGELGAGLETELASRGFNVVGAHAKESTRFVPDGLEVLTANAEAVDDSEVLLAAYGANRSFTGDDVGDALTFFRAAHQIGGRDGHPLEIVALEVTAPELQAANTALKRAADLAGQEGIKVRYLDRNDAAYSQYLAGDGVHYHDYSPMAVSDAELLAALMAPVAPEPEPQPPAPTSPPVAPPPTVVAPAPEPEVNPPLSIPIAAPATTIVMPHLANRQPLPTLSTAIDIKIGGRQATAVPAASLTKPINIPVVEPGNVPQTGIRLAEMASSTMPAMVDSLPTDPGATPLPTPQSILQVTAPEAPPPTSQPETVAPNDAEIVAKAAEYGIFYDPDTRQARQQLNDFVDRAELPKRVVTEGFADERTLNGTRYRQGNRDESTESSVIGRRDVHVIAPATGIYHEVYTEGEGLKVFIEFGTSERTGKPWMWYNTHMSESIGIEGQIVNAGDVIGRAGMTGSVVTSYPIFSVGLTDQFNVDEMSEYANHTEAVNPADYSVPGLEFSCRSTALDDPGNEFCDVTEPGVYYSLPVHPRVLETYAIPDSFDTIPVITPPEPSTGHLRPLRLAISVAEPEAPDSPGLAELASEEPPVPTTPTPGGSEVPDFTPSARDPFSVFDTPDAPEVPDDTTPPSKLPDKVPPVGEIDEDTAADDEFDSTPITPPTTVPPVEPPIAPPPAEEPANPEPVAPPEALYPNEVAVPAALSQTYWIDENGGVHAEELFNIIEQRWPIPAESEMFAANSRYRILDEIPGVPYGFSDIASYPERYGNLKLVATSVIMPLEYKKFKAEFEARTGQIIDDELRYSDADSAHNEHRHGDDLDWLLINNTQARHEFAMRIADWQEPGGEPWFRHIVTGEASMEAEGDAFVASVGQERPNFVYQANHGSNPSVESHHMHLSTGPGYSGPFTDPESHVPLTTGLNIPEPPLARGMDWDGFFAWAQETAQNVLGPVNPPAPEPTPEPAPEPAPEPPAPEPEPVPQLSPLEARRQLLEADPLAFADPEWRELAWEANARPENAGINDARLPLTVLWVENRGFPEDPYGISAVSGANARGWFQVLPQTHFGWNTGVDSWYGPNGEENYLNESLYSSSGVGRDGDGDGIRNPDNPRDAIAAAFQVMPGTLGDPITFEGLTGDPTVDIYNAIFVKDEETLLSRIANYNGDGRTPNHVTLGTLTEMYLAGDNPMRDQNKAYIVMGAALLLTDLEFGVFLDHRNDTLTWVDSETLEPVSPELVRATVTGN